MTKYKVLRHKFLPFVWSQIVRDIRDKVLSIQKIPADSQCNDGYYENCGKYLAKHQRMENVAVHSIPYL